MDSCDFPPPDFFKKARVAAVVALACVSVNSWLPPIFFSMFTAVCNFFWLFIILYLESDSIIRIGKKDRFVVFLGVDRKWRSSSCGGCISTFSDTTGFDCRRCLIRSGVLNLSLSVSLRFQVIEFRIFNYVFPMDSLKQECTWNLYFILSFYLSREGR